MSGYHFILYKIPKVELRWGRRSCLTHGNEARGARSVAPEPEPSAVLLLPTLVSVPASRFRVPAAAILSAFQPARRRKGWRKTGALPLRTIPGNCTRGFHFILCAKTEPRAHVQLQWSLGNVVFVPGDHTTQRKLEGSVAKENRETGSFSSMGRPCSRSVLRSVCHTISPPNLGLRSSHSTKAFWLLAIPLLKSF